MAVENIWVGAVTSSGAWVRGKVSGSSVRLVVSKSPALSSPTYFGPVSPTAQNIASVTATGLDADTQYYYAFEVDSTVDTDFAGKFHTHATVGDPYSFTFAVSGDSGNSQLDVLGQSSPYITSRISNRPIFSTIAGLNPLFFVHLGDLHYVDITTGANADYRTAFDNVLTYNGTEGADAHQGILYRNVPLVYIWDDHDYSGNDSDGSYTGKAAPAAVYRERVPSYTLAESSAIYHEFKVGRVQFICTDSRYYRDAGATTPTMLGSAQMTWLEGVLQNSDAEFLVFCTQMQWHTGGAQAWDGFPDERDTIAGWLDTYNWTDRMVMVTADKHSLGMDTGANNSYGGFPVYLLSSLDCGGGTSDGPYDLGVSGGRDRYGLIDVEDTGDTITVTTTGYVGTSPFATHAVSVDLSGTVTAPDTTDPVIEIKLGSTWTDISEYVYQRDKVTITRGRADETSQTQPGSCTFTVNNADGRFSPRNPLSPYYGLIGRNTPVRVSVVRNDVQYFRFYGETSAWPVKWDTSGNDVYVPVQAGGLLRRLGQGNNPIRSAMTRDLTKASRNTIVGYWPMEDVGGSFSSAHPGEPPLRIASGALDFASYSDWYASDALPAMKNAKVSGNVPAYEDLGQVSFRFFTYTPSALSGTTNLARLTCNGSIRTWKFNTNADGDLTVIATANDGTEVYNSGLMAFDLVGRQCMITAELVQDTADINVAFIRTDVGNNYRFGLGGEVVEITDTITSASLGVATGVELNLDRTLGDVVIGQVSVAKDVTAYANAFPALGSFNDEASTIRFKRLCDEESIPREVIFSPTYAGNSTRLGNQRVKTLLDLLNEIENHNHGMLYEGRSQLSLGYRDRLSLYNQPAAITLSYADGDLSGELEPVEDDQGLTNDVTVTRDGGSSARYEVTSGPLSISPPPEGVGRYDTSNTLSLAFDYYAYPQAGWSAHLGTVDEARYPQVTIDLSMEPYASSTTKTADVLGLDVGDRIVITDLPDWLPPGDITLMIQGYTETLDPYQPTITFNCTPESAWHVGAVEDTNYSRLGSSGSTLALAVDTDDTSLSVTSGGALWTTASGAVPFNITVGGEEMTVTAISGSSSPQTFTVTRSVNDITKSHDIGEAVKLTTPIVIAL